MFNAHTFNDCSWLSCLPAGGVHSQLSLQSVVIPANSRNYGRLPPGRNGHKSGIRIGVGSKKGAVMLRYILLILSIWLLTGCSELKVIGSAAMRELRAEGMNVEQISYNYNQKLVAREKSGGVMLAKAGENRVAMERTINAGEKKIILAKVRRVRGLWEKGSL